MTIQSTTIKPHRLDEKIKILEKSVNAKPEIAKFQAALGVLYMRRNDQKRNDKNKAIECFGKAIEIAPNHKDTVLAYANRGRIYRIQKCYDEALKDLNIAKEYFGIISKPLREQIEEDINSVQKALMLSNGLRSGGANASVKVPTNKFYNLLMNDEGLKTVEEFAPSTTLFFSQLLLFLNKNMDSQVNATANFGSDLYWKALALCTKALSQEKKSGLTDHICSLYDQAREGLEELLRAYLRTEKSPPSIIHYVTATVYFKLEKYNQSLEQINLAIKGNPDGDAIYYRFRALLNDELGNDDAAKADEQMALKIDPDPPYYSMVRSAYNEVSHCIEFYDQVKVDETNYYIPDSFYESLADIGVKIVPKRGMELGSIGHLYAKRAMLSAIMGRTYPEKLVESLEDAGLALSELSNQDPVYLKVMVGRAQVYAYMKNYEEAIKDLNAAIEMAPKFSEFYIQRAHVYLKMENYKAALADIERVAMLKPEKSEEIERMREFVRLTMEKNQKIGETVLKSDFI